MIEIYTTAHSEYQRERMERDALVHGIAEGVVAALGSEWELKPELSDDTYTERRTIRKVGERDACFSLTVIKYGSQKGRITVYGNWYKYRKFMPYNAVVPSITVSSAKPPAVIAGDIKKRFLPKFDALLNECLAAKEKTERYEAEIGSRAKLLADAAGGTFILSPDSEGKFGSTLTPDGSKVRFYGSVSVYGEDVSMELRNFSMDEATKIMRLLATFKKSPVKKGNGLDVSSGGTFATSVLGINVLTHAAE